MIPLNISLLCGFITIACALNVFTGWLLDIPFLTNLRPSLPASTPLTALMIGFLGASVCISEFHTIKRKRSYLTTSRLITLGTLTLCIWLIAEYLVPKITQIDLLLFKENLSSRKHFLHPGRPSPRTLITVSLAAIALFMSSLKLKNNRLIAHTLCIIGMIIPWVALFGYAGLASNFYSYQPKSGIGMSAITAFMSISLFVGIISLDPNFGIMGLIRSKSLSGRMTRILLPLVVLLPLLISFFIGYTINNKSIDASIAFISSLGFISLLSGALIVITAFHIQSKEAINEKLLKAIQQSEASYHQLVTDIKDYAIIKLDLEGCVLVWNKGAEKITGYTEKDVLHQSFSAFFTPADVAAGKPEKILLEAKELGSSKYEGWKVKKNGIIFWGNTVVSSLKDTAGNLTGYVNITQDLTSKKEHENIIIKAGKRFKLLLESTPDPMLIINNEGDINFSNRLAKKLFAQPHEEITHHNIGKYIPDFNSIINIGSAKSNTSPSLTKTSELNGINHLGDRFPIEISVSTIRDEKSDAELAVSLRDITKRINREKQRKEYLKNLELAQQTGQMGYFEINLLTGKCLVSENFSLLFGITTTEYCAEDFLKELNSKERFGFLRKFKSSLNNKSSFSTEYTIINPQTKKKQHIYYNSYFVYNAQGVATDMIGLQQDITYIKKNEIKIKELNIQLMQSNNDLQAFSYSVSHDLRAPLRAIIGFSNKLMKKSQEFVDSETLRIIDIIVKNTNQMDRLIDDILAFSRVSREHVSNKPINMTAIFSHSYHNLIETWHTPLNINFKIADLPNAYGDETMIRQVATNLLSNAIKYSSKKNNIEIEVGYFKDNRQITYFVKDNGVGFDMRHKKKLFGVFQRLHNDADFEGTGVGLAITKKIIEKHGGDIWADATLGVGATFLFSFNHDHDEPN